MAKFYTEVFGWKITHMPQMEYWLIVTGDASTPGINGGLMQRRGPHSRNPRPNAPTKGRGTIAA